MIAYQSNDGRTAGPDRVAVTRTFRTIIAVQTHHRRFLPGKCLYRITAFDLGFKVDLKNFSTNDLCHDNAIPIHLLANELKRGPN